MLSLGEFQTPLDEGSEQVGLRLRMVLLHPGGQHLPHVATAHVRRIRRNHRVGTVQVLRLGHHLLSARVQTRDVQSVRRDRC